MRRANLHLGVPVSGQVYLAGVSGSVVWNVRRGILPLQAVFWPVVDAAEEESWHVRPRPGTDL